MALDFVVDTFVGSDGSKYYGTLRSGVPSGLGTCIWPNQCHYDGEWRDGLMHGFGTYVWKSGQRYDGEWKDGRREGIGIKTYADASMYDGFWRAGRKHGLGVFRPAPEDTGGSRRHSNNAGWQQQQQPQRVSANGTPAAAAAGAGADGTQQQQDQLDGAGGDASPTAATEQAHAAGSGHDCMHAGPAAAAVIAATHSLSSSSSQQQQQYHQHPPAVLRSTSSGKSMVSPFAAAAASLGSDASLLGEPPKLAEGSWQEQQSLTPAAPPAAAAVAVSVQPAAAPGAAGAGAGAAAAAPAKLFVREYDMGRLVREYPLTAAEIKMIFGFLWPKHNKVRARVARVLRRGPRLQKKLGEVVYKGHYSYSLMLELQLGIRYSVGRGLWPSTRSSTTNLRALAGFTGVLAPWAPHGSGNGSGGGSKQQQQAQGQGGFKMLQASSKGGHQRTASDALTAEGGLRQLEALDFKEERTVYFPSCGSSTTPAHPSTDFSWKDYCPRVFRRLRAAAGIDDADYMLSLAGSQALRQLNSPGKSGSMFLLSEDERFLVKTMRKSEMRVLTDMLPTYTAHMQQHPHSLITRFFGLHKVRPLHGRSVRFVVMANIFVTDLQIHRRYDIKGSTEGRTVGPAARAKAADGDPGVIFKDLDVDTRIVLEQSAHEKLMAQLAADCELLRTVGVMDYSLLLGVHYPARNFTRASLEAMPSISLDGLPPPQTSPLPGSTLPGSAMGSFSEANGTASAAAAAAAAAGAAAASTGGGCSQLPPVALRPAAVSDDDTQQPPQNLQRLLAQQQQLVQQLQQGQAQAQQQQQVLTPRQQQGEFVGAWSMPGAARLTGCSSVSSIGSERLQLEASQLYPPVPANGQLSAATSPLPPSHGLQQQQQQQQEALTPTSRTGSGSGVESDRQQQQQQQQQPFLSLTPRGSVVQQQQPWASSGDALMHAFYSSRGGGGSHTAPAGWSMGGTPSTAAAAAAAANVIAAAGAAANGGSALGGVLGNGATAGGSMSAPHPHLLAMAQGSTSGTRNWELFSGAAELEEQLSKVSARMQAMGFSDQRIKDVAELARLKILGSKLKKSAARKEPPSAVLQAMQQQRKVAESSTTGGALGPDGGAPPSTTPLPGMVTSPSTAGAAAAALRQMPTLSHLTSLRGVFTGLGVPFEEDEDVVDTPMALGLPDPKAPAPTPPAVPHAAAVGYTTATGLQLGHQLGINMLALAVPQPCAADALVGAGHSSSSGSKGGGGGDSTRASSGAGAAAAAAACRGGGAGASGAGASSSGKPSTSMPGAAEAPRGPEEVVLCFGIIDILQDYSTRKVLERAFKGLTHDKAAISVAPPKHYAKRFLEFVSTKVFMAENEYYRLQAAQQQQHALAAYAAHQPQHLVNFGTRRVSEASSIDEGPMLPLHFQQSLQQQQAAAAAAAAAGGGSAAAAAAAAAGVAPGAHDHHLSASDAQLLAAGQHDMSLQLLGSPDALSPCSARGMGDGSAQHSGLTAVGSQQLISAEEVSVSVPRVSEGGEGSSSQQLPLVQHQQAAFVGGGGHALPVLKQQRQPAWQQGAAGDSQEDDEGHADSSSPAEAIDVIVVDGSGSANGHAQPQPQQAGKRLAGL